MASKIRKNVKEKSQIMSEVLEDKSTSPESPLEKETASESNKKLKSQEMKKPDIQKDFDANGTEEQQETSETSAAISNEADEAPTEVKSEEQQETSETSAAAASKIDEAPLQVKTEEQLKKAQQQIETFQDRLLRTNAEFENYKKRMAKESAERFKYYHMGLVKELLPALDSLERAIEHGQKENTTTEAMLEGIQMVYKLNQEALEKFSVSKIEAIGEPFDPAVHQAVGMVESDTVPEDHVVDQFQIGYQLHDRVIRPAMVRVSKKQ